MRTPLRHLVESHKIQLGNLPSKGSVSKGMNADHFAKLTFQKEYLKAMEGRGQRGFQARSAHVPSKPNTIGKNWQMGGMGGNA